MSSAIREYGELFINGEFTKSTSGDELKVVDPASEEEVATIQRAKEDDIDRAVKSAEEGQNEWQGLEPKERARILRKIRGELLDNKEKLARVVTVENGKPISQSRSEVENCARYFEYYAGLADKINGESIPLSNDYTDFTLREPLGVTAQILPWNFPVALFGRSVAPALAAGNASVAKPAEQTPVSGLILGEILKSAGIPNGVVNVVPGYGAEAGASLASHPAIDNVSFTGSVVTGRKVAKLAVDNVNPVHLELGGKSPLVVFPDADFSNAIDNQINGIFKINSGQVCSAASRLLVHEDVYDEFLDELVSRASELSVGNGQDDPDLGPLVSQDQYEKVKNYMEIGKSEIGEPMIGGEVNSDDGYIVKPTIFEGVPNDSRIAQEEIFGPVLTVLSFSDEEEAIQIANDTIYGLVAGVFTSDVGRAHRFAKNVEAGQIYINEWFAGGVETPFGGYKQSGFGREKGMEAIHANTQVKNVCANIKVTNDRYSSD